ncbi:MAG: P1 family peptidase [Acidobacteria bacterium]|nr:P1 family peptidase [Acidobacteriota bacterium]
MNTGRKIHQPQRQRWCRLVLLAGLFLVGSSRATPAEGTAAERGRARDFGIVVGILSPGPANSITDVTGVKVGHVTLRQGETVRTGVTAVLPHDGNIFRAKVPAAIHVGNGFGKLAGLSQVNELGELETPVVLTNTLAVGRAVEGVVTYTLARSGNEGVHSVNAVVGETNDRWLNDIRSMPVTKEHVVQAISAASAGPAAEGCVGAGTGTVCFGFKGGIGTASRRLPGTRGGWTVGVIVQTNFGGVLQVNGAPVGRELGEYYMQTELFSQESGSCMVVVATDAPLLHRNLQRLAARALQGLTRTGGFGSNGSGDYVIAFSTFRDNRIAVTATGVQTRKELPNHELSPLFLAVVEATEEAVLNSLFRAETTRGVSGRTVEALPIQKVLEICRRYGVIGWDRRLPPGAGSAPDDSSEGHENR